MDKYRIVCLWIFISSIVNFLCVMEYIVLLNIKIIKVVVIN